VVAAYLVGGFLIASVYAMGMLRGRNERYYRLGFIIPFTVAAIATPLQMAVGDALARWVFNDQPEKFAAIELVPQTQADVPETLLGHLNANGTVSGGIPIPGLASWLSDPSTGTSTVVKGLDAVPAAEQPTISDVNVVHLAWDVMVGVGTLLFLLALWYAAVWVLRRRMPASLKEQRVGNDRADCGDGDETGQRVLGTVQQDAHRKIALGLDINDCGLGATAARSGFVLGRLLRHFSSPELVGREIGPEAPGAAPVSASRSCSRPPFYRASWPAAACRRAAA